jgi:uncharacterized repeat protein (TIGR01451 family)
LDHGPVNAGDPIGFTLTVYNTGSGDAKGVSLSDVLPTNAGLSWTIASQGAGWSGSCAITAGTLNCGPKTVPAGTTQAASTFTVHITSTTTAATGGVCPDGSGVINNTGNVATTNDGAVNADASPQGLPLLKPPYGRLTAIDLDRGDIVWQVAHGETPDNIRNHAALKGLTIPRTGQSGIVGTLVTKTLVVAGDRQITTTPDRPRGAMLRAYDKATGAEVGSVFMPSGQTGGPMTYMLNGKQYIVVAVSGGNYSGEYIAFSVPDDARTN